MNLINFNFDYYSNYVDLYFDNGSFVRVFFNEHTGQIYKRPKIHPILKHFLDHKGLCIGTSSCGETIMVHNHISPGHADVVTWAGFAENDNVSPDIKNCSNSPSEMVAIALQKVLDREPYDPINYSCQTLVNMSCNNQRRNDDTGRAIAGILGTIAFFTIIASIFNE